MHKKEYNYNPQRWRKAGRLLDEAGTVYPSKGEAEQAFLKIVEEVMNKNTFSNPLQEVKKAVFSITHPKTLEARILTLEDEGGGEFSLSFQHC